MRLRAVPLSLAVLVALATCGCANEVAGKHSAQLPTAVSCTDAPQLRQRAIGDRRQSAKLASDHEKIVMGSRAGFLASLAIVADLMCKVTLPEADEALKPAFEAARKAEAASSMYEKAFEWREADFVTTEVIALLVERLPAPSKQPQ